MTAVETSVRVPVIRAETIIMWTEETALTAKDLNSSVLKRLLHGTADTGPACSMPGWFRDLTLSVLESLLFGTARLMKQALGSLRARLSSPFKTAPNFFLAEP